MKKILTLLALMIATVAVVATGYKLTRPAKAAGDVTTYTDKLAFSASWYGEHSTDEAEVKVTDNGDGTYTFVLPKEVGESFSFADAPTYTLTGTTDANGYTSYTGTTSEGATVTGKSKDDKLYLAVSGKIYYCDNSTLTFGTPFADEPVYTSTTYTDQLTGKGGILFYDGYTTSDVTAKVIDKTDGTYDISFPGLKLTTDMGTMNFGDVVYSGIAGTVDSKGYTVYSGTADGMTITGKSKDDKLYLEMEGTFQGKSGVTIVYGTEFAEEIEIPEGTKVGEDGYAAGGKSFCWDNNTIDWDSQKLVALVDVSTCTGTNEDIFSVGQTIANWSPGAHVHFYYTRSSKSLEIDYLDDNNGNYVRKQLTFDDDQLLFEISKENGFTVNGVNFNYKNGGSLLTDFATEYAPFWALTSIQVGGCQGDNMSNATYKYVRIVNLATEPEAVVYTDAAQSIYGGTTTDQTDQTVEITETAEGKYTVVYKQLTLGTTAIGDFTATDVEGTTDEDGYVNYTFDGKATVSNVGMVASLLGVAEGSEVGFTMTGKSKDGKLQAKFTTTAMSGNEGVVLFGGYTEPVKPVTYTDKFVYTIMDYETTKDEYTITVTDNGDGTYKFEMPSVGMYNVTFPAVPGTVNEDGTISYEGTNVEGTVNSDGDKCTMNITGKSDGTKLYLYCDGKILEFDGVNRFVFGTPFKTVEPGRVIGEDEYEPNGTAFSYDDITIDWDKEYFEASIDLSNCKNSFENILSIGETISGWGGGNRLHFFYTASTHTLQPNFMAPDNVSRFNIKLDGDQLLIQLSKRHGLVINGQPALYTYNDDSNTTGETYDDLDAYLEATKTFWALASYSVGSTQGDTRSNAKYNYIRVKELPAEEPTIESTETFTDQLVTTDANQTRHTMTDKTLDINKYTDDTYGVTFHGVETANDVLGDITVKGIEVTETEDGTVYNGEDLTAVINDENSSLNGKEVKVTITGQKDKDGKVLFMFEITREDDPSYYIVVGEFGTEDTPVVGTKYYGTWDLTYPESTFNGNVTAINNEDGTYSFDVENFTLNGAEVGNFTVKNVPATTAADGSVTLGNNYDTYEVEYKGAAPDNAVTKFQYVTGYIKNGKLHLVTSYVNYGTGTDQARYVVFDGTDVPNGINGINAAELNGNAQIFTIGGARVNSLQKGINIVRVNGKTMKVVKK